jgi:hypothetical protein
MLNERIRLELDCTGAKRELVRAVSQNIEVRRCLELRTGARTRAGELLDLGLRWWATMGTGLLLDTIQTL